MRVIIPTFGGMIPALSDRLLPDTGAAYAENCWLYDGRLRGLPTPKLAHTLVNSTAAKVYRIPDSTASPDDIFDSTWIEFSDVNTDVIRSPVFGDTYERYYWASSSIAPKYNTVARIRYSADPPSFDFTTTNATNTFNATAHGLVAGDPIQFTTTGTLPTGLSLATTYYVSSSNLGTDSFEIATSYILAIQGTTVVGISDDGSGTHTATGQEQGAFFLGIPQPGTITVTPDGAGSGGSDTRSYVVTWVSAYGEEGPPSDPVTATGKADDQWDIGMPTVSANDKGIDRNLRYFRIYRTVVSGSGVATYYKVADQDIWDTSDYADTDADDVVASNATLESTLWTAPPSDLKSIVQMANGIVAGFRENEVWFSEPYRPHAWPSVYALTTDYPVVGIGAANQALVVCTSGTPMTVSGVNPANLSVSRYTAVEPCISRGSILSTTEGVYYASSNGLILARHGSVENITRGMLTRDKWQELINRSAIRSARFGLSYYAFGTGVSGSFEPTAFETTAFAQEDFSNAFLGMLIDPTDQRVSFTRLASDDAVSGVQTDPWTGEVFVIRDGGVYWVDLGDETVADEDFVWKSKVFQTTEITNFAAMKIYWQPQPVTPGSNGTVKLYADGDLVFTKTIPASGELIRLPSGYKGALWQIVLESSLRITQVQMATSVKELAAI